MTPKKSKSRRKRTAQNTASGPEPVESAPASPEPVESTPATPESVESTQVILESVKSVQTQEDPTQLVMYSVVPEVYSLEPTPKPPTPPAKSVLKESNLDDLIDWCCSNSFVLQPSFVQA